MKKFLSFIFALLVLVPCTYFLTACGEDKGKEKVMTLELNPSLEFVLDKNDKVVTVNALNEDGNYLLSLTVENGTEMAKEAFKNMSAEEAAELFLTLTRNNGFLVSGDEETLTISISGSETDLLNSVKNTAKKYLEDKGVDLSKLTLQVEELKKSELVSKVKECMQEYADKELNNMSEEELVALIKESRKETEDLLTQDLKEAYYALRNSALENAEFQAVLDKVEALTGSLNTVFTDFTSCMNTFKSQMTELYGKFEDLLKDETYQAKVQEYVDAKKALLEKRKELLDSTLTDEQKQAIEDTLDGLETAANSAYSTIDTARTSIDSAINSAKAALDGALTNVQNIIENVKNAIKTFVPNIENDINTALATAKEDFKTEFERTYANYLESYWKTTETSSAE